MPYSIELEESAGVILYYIVGDEAAIMAPSSGGYISCRVEGIWPVYSTQNVINVLLLRYTCARG